MKVAVIHDESLKDRVKFVNGTLHKLKEYVPNLNISLIQEPNKIDSSDIKNKVRLEKINDSDFDRHITILEEPQILNIEKHKKALDLAIDTDDVVWILEDDVVISTDYAKNIKNILENIKYDWDILFTSFSIDTDDLSSDIKYINTLPQYKILPSKSSYMIKPKMARNLKFYLENYKYTMRISLSKFIWDNQDWILSKTTDKHLFLETSKLGMSPSTINHSNTLIYNIDYIKMLQMVNEPITEDKIKEAKILFKKQEHLNSPDIYHIMGVIYHRKEMYDDAKEMLIKATSLLEEKQGYMGKYSEILNNTINIFQFNQPDLENYLNVPSKYC